MSIKNSRNVQALPIAYTNKETALLRFKEPRKKHQEMNMNPNFPILLAEDDPVTRKLLKKNLVRAGYQVTCVENGHEALTLFKKSFYPIVLTDWIMPEMDGLELCRAIRKISMNGYVYIIMLTVRDSKTDIISGLEAGADDYLTKPVNNAELIARLKTGTRVLELEKSLKTANKEIKILSTTDPLTGSYNRSYMQERFPWEIRRAKRYNRSLSVVMCDIDHFKSVNDTYGHQMGDTVLKELVRGIKESVRQEIDWVCRYGGEEFLIVTPETDIAGASVMAERLRDAISKKKFRRKGIEIGITISFGVTGFDMETPDHKITPENMVSKADEYLYQAKQAGRNRVRSGQL
jgi:diguanylate cyclase (GGDEF)-like protein